MKNSLFYKQADLLIRILPHLAAEPDFALHGGTAINFFVRDMPRLSVDIDLTYLPIESRENTTLHISKKLQELAKRVRNAFPGIRIEEKRGGTKREVSKLFVNYRNALVKIEVNQVIRGSVFPVEERDLSKKAEKTFEKFVSVKTLPLAALYGSKICAALDRQHPRDLFDIKLLLKNEGITEGIRKAFLVYLISGNRPMSELLNPKLKDVKAVFENEFLGMTLIPVTCEDLEKARKDLIKRIHDSLTKEERQFLISFKQKDPEWQLLGVEGVQDLPAVRWKLENLEKISPEKRSQASDGLKKILGVA